jgi:hypothetical protein
MSDISAGLDFNSFLRNYEQVWQFLCSRFNTMSAYASIPHFAHYKTIEMFSPPGTYIGLLKPLLKRA